MNEALLLNACCMPVMSPYMNVNRSDHRHKIGGLDRNAIVVPAGISCACAESSKMVDGSINWNNKQTDQTHEKRVEAKFHAEL